MFTHEVQVLFRKELRQILRSRSALLSALLFPFLFLLIIPCLQMIGLSAAPASFNSEIPEGIPLPPGLVAVGDDPRLLLRSLLLPLFMTIGGLIVPSVMATYTMIAERENRTLELLVALPVRVEQILLAKLLVIVGLAGAVTLTIFAVDAILVLALGIGSLAYVVALLLLLVTTLGYSTASALLISLLARDFRTANNFTGALIAPTVFLTVGILAAIPGIFAILVLALIFAIAALAATVIALRVVTFERLMR
jgi:ABC-2 type transport system permease protein